MVENVPLNNWDVVATVAGCNYFAYTISLQLDGQFPTMSCCNNCSRPPIITLQVQKVTMTSHQARRYRPNCVLTSLGTPTKSIGSELSVVPIAKTNVLDFFAAQNHDLEPFRAGWPPLESKNHVRWRRPAGSKWLQIVILSKKIQKVGFGDRYIPHSIRFQSIWLVSLRMLEYNWGDIGAPGGSPASLAGRLQLLQACKVSFA